jgi:head decoration protein D
MANQTYDLPLNLGDLMGAYDEAHWQTQVCEIKAGIGVLTRGTILATGTAGDIGKLVKLTAGTEAQAYGVLLDPAIDTAQAFSDGSVTGSVAKAGSFRGPALVVPTGVDAGLISVALRGRGIFIEGAITVPPAGAVLAPEEPEPEATEKSHRRQRSE